MKVRSSQNVKTKAQDTPLSLCMCLALLYPLVGFQRCSFRRTGQCEGLQNVERVTELAPRSLFLYANHISINRQEGAIGKKHIKMKKIFTLRFILVSLFAAMSIVTSAEVIRYESYRDGSVYHLNTETKTAELSKPGKSMYNISNHVAYYVIPETVTYNDEVYIVTSLGDECFKGLTFHSITIPSSITSVGAFCFSDCTSLTSVVIPSSVTSLGAFCFSDCKFLKSINIPSSVTNLGYACFFHCTSLTSIDIPSSVTSMNYCFSGCTSLKYIEIPSSVTSLDGCFEGCISLTSIDIPFSITSIGYYCFSGCTSLRSMIIPPSVTSIGIGCFKDCTSLTFIYIPSSVTIIDDWCFQNCASLKTVICEIPTAIERDYYFSFFFDTPLNQATLYVPDDSMGSYLETFPWNYFHTIRPISLLGVEKIATDKEATIDAIYNLEGKRIKGTQRGLNIIRMSDGTTKKVIK